MHNKPASDNRTGYRLNSLFMLLLLIALPVLLAWGSSRYSAQFDWTREGRHSLSDTSIRLLDQIDGPVTVTSYVREQGGLRELISDFVGKFQRSKQDIELRFVNPDSAPDQVRALGITINGEMVLQYQGRSEHLREADEGVFINALIRLSRDSEKWIAFIEGHGERNPLGKANHDLGEWASRLGNRGYRIQPLNLAEITTIPDNISVLVLASPRIELLQGETELLLQYLQQGGNLLWLLDPDERFLPEALLDFLDISIPGGTVIDVAGQLIGIDDPTITMVTNSLYGQHAALTNFSFTTLFPKATALVGNTDSIWQITPLLNTGDHTWQKSTLADNNIELDEQSDLRGPFSIGLSLERELAAIPEGSAQQRIIVIGDGDFVSNTYLGNSGNLDLGLRLLNWLSEDDDLIEIPARTTMDTQLNLTPTVAGTVGIFFLLGLPLLLTASGLLIWWRRKRS